MLPKRSFKYLKSKLCITVSALAVALMPRITAPASTISAKTPDGEVFRNDALQFTVSRVP
ncbi:Uncharacterised protein [Vibrio cholerae]|nr:Uncharacterised protein [Vibrio cholerae]